MSKYDEVIEFVDNQYMLTTDDFKRNKISYYYIQKLLKDGYITQSGKGVYYKSDMFEDEFYILQHRFKEIIFSYNIALYFMNKTEITPSSYDITVPYNYHVYIDHRHIRIHYVNKDQINLGAITVKSPYGNDIRCYSYERTICDIVKKDTRTDIDIEQRNKIIRAAFYDYKDTDWTLIYKYAKILKCDNKLNNLIEILE